jgi:hypothetical protein
MAAINPLIINKTNSGPPNRLIRYLRRGAKIPANNRPGRKRSPASRVLLSLRFNGTSEPVGAFVAIVS